MSRLLVEPPAPPPSAEFKRQVIFEISATTPPQFLSRARHELIFPLDGEGPCVVGGPKQTDHLLCLWDPFLEIPPLRWWLRRI